MDALKSKGQMYDQINLEQIPRSGFDLSHSVRGTGKIGRLIPIRNMETQPGDSIKGSTQIALQFEPLAVPMLASMRVKTEHWYVPFNTLWKDWDKFITKGQDLSDDSSVPTFTLKDLFKQFFELCRVYDVQMKIGVFDRSEKQDKSDLIAGIFVLRDNMLANISKVKDTLLTSTASIMYKARQAQCDDLLDYVYDLIDEFMQTIVDADCVHLDATTGDVYIPLLRYKPSAVAKEIIGYGTKKQYHFKRRGHGQVISRVDYVKDETKPVYDAFKLTGVDIATFADFGYMSDLDMQIAQSTEVSSSYFLPSDFFIAWTTFLYDMLSPIVGLGSNLDYLGYQKILPVDFYYLFLRHFEDFTVLAAGGSNTLQYVLNFALEKYRDSQEIVGSDFTFFWKEEDSNWSIELDKRFTQSMPQIILPLRAFYAIWWNNYRDQLLETAAPEPITESIITSQELFHLVMPRQRAWSKDTFTTALANTGTGSVIVPVNPKLEENTSEYYSLKNDGSDADSAALQDMNLKQITLSDGKVIDLPTRYLSAFHTTTTDGSGEIQGFSLDMLRRAGRAEKWIQKALIYGNRIQDALFTHWRVTIKNERLQLPEFISSSVQLVRMDTILNNTTTSESVAGDKAGFASAYDNGVNFDEYSPEIGVILSIMSVMPEQSYAAGSPRFLSKIKIFDYAFPEFAQIGMDAVYNSELVNSPMDGAAVDITKVFGYQGRYYDYKCKQDEDHGELLTTQDMYTFSRKFNPYDPQGVPRLNYRFVHCFPRLDMFVADSAAAYQFRYDVHHSVACSRALPVCGMSV